MGNFFCCRKKINLDQDFSYLKVFTYTGRKVNARVTDVYDGDTITIVFYDYEYKKFKLRLSGLDTPEIKPLLKIDHRDLHIKCAKIAKKYVSDIILDKIVELDLKGEDKYGRLLGYIYYDGKCINNLLVDNGYALPYDGKTKTEFSQYFLQNIIFRNTNI